VSLAGLGGERGEGSTGVEGLVEVGGQFGGWASAAVRRLEM